jgi:hypothetical protein
MLDNNYDSEGEANFKLTKLTKFETIEFERMSTKITKEEIEKFLISSKLTLFKFQRKHKS